MQRYHHSELDEMVGRVCPACHRIGRRDLGPRAQCLTRLEAGIAAGIAFGLADGAKVLIPLAAGIIGWSRQMKITAAVCVAVGLWSAVNVYLDGAGSAFLAKQQGAEAYGAQAKAITELESEVARLPPLAAAEAKNKGCGKNCKAVNEQAAVARQQLADAPPGAGRTRSPSKSLGSRG